jgi:hypothetical protein
MYAQEQIDQAVQRIVSGYAPEMVILFGSCPAFRHPPERA